MADFFQAPTIRAMAHRLDAERSATTEGSPTEGSPAEGTAGAGPEAAGPVGAGQGDDDAGVEEEFPPTAMQRRLWRRHHANPRPAVYNVSHRITIEGELDPEALRRALDRLVRRHAGLRMLMTEGDPDPGARILSARPVELPVADLAGAGEEEVRRWCDEVVRPPFDLRRPWLFRFRLARTGARSWVLVVVLHHIVCDGWSLGLLWADLSALYTAEVTGDESALPEPGTPYPRYADWHRARAGRPEHGRLVEWWRDRLAGAPLRLALPYDRPRPARLSGRGDLVRVAVPGELAGSVEAAARAVGATPPVVLTAAFATWMARLCGQDDLVLQVSSANRTERDHERTVGLIGDSVPLRVRPLAEASFAALCRELGRALFEVADHPLPISEILDLVLPEQRVHAFTNVLFTVVTVPPPALDLPGLTAAVESVPVTGTARTELYVALVPAGDSYEALFEYSTDLFDRSTVATWAQDFLTFLGALTAEPESPSPLLNVPPLPERPTAP
ncbi:hypothetical protein D5H75_10425 [Bailinhaonella thermotolerans]|uniref:Condensation domain-containing protein n=2 Tax=Bailinhaonella thermotolerans TaxID=1070861 RepID=A0A3A4B6E8_9ACTN|nr:hypothetical protein D5H75_10425 [Bailinhaonella thermotolerans]